jgi:PilZ domain
MATLRQQPHGRLENRVRAVYPVYLNSDKRQVLAETAYTEDVSEHGARILSRRNWTPNERVQVESIQWGLRAVARVAYCRPAQDAEFTVGLQFLTPVSSAWTAI